MTESFSSMFLDSVETEFAGVIGDPVRHSLSPRLHNCAYRELGVNLRYGAFHVLESELAYAVAGARALGFRGLSVTTPHKDALAVLADQCSDDVTLLGAANTVVFLGGVSIAHSTDGKGLIDDLESHLGFVPRGRVCAVLGAGGAARSIILALARAGASAVLVVNRNSSRAADAISVAPDVAHHGSIDEVGSAELVINATSLGLSGDPFAPDVLETVALLTASIHKGQIAIDLSYRPARSAFLAAAADHGAQIRNGLGMLVHQAAEQVHLFTGLDAPISAMWRAVNDVVDK